MHKSVLKFLKSARCSQVEALEAASLHPARALGLAHKKGSLAYGADADLIVLDRASLRLLSTWIGEAAWIPYTDKKENKIFLVYKEIQKGAVAKSYTTKGLLIYD
jgi:imidazolonepropionase-like amidohydrolase